MRSFRLTLTIAALVLAALPAGRALALDDPDTEVARRHFEAGRTAYDAQNYELALREFQAAKRAKNAAALDYNIARCYDRLENYQKAIEHYQLYAAALPGAPDLAETRERIAALKARLATAEAHPDRTPPVEPPSDRLIESTMLKDNPADLALRMTPPDHARESRRRTTAIVLGVVAGALVVAGAITLGVLLSGSSVDYTPSTLGLVKSTR